MTTVEGTLLARNRLARFDKRVDWEFFVVTSDDNRGFKVQSDVKTLEVSYVHKKKHWRVKKPFCPIGKRQQLKAPDSWRELTEVELADGIVATDFPPRGKRARA